jgi:hypothetical protein
MSSLFDMDAKPVFVPYTPNRNALLVFRVSSLDRLTAMQHGLLYMNSLSYFSKIENEASENLRGDLLEPILGRIYGGPAGEYSHIFELHMRDGTVLDISENALLTVEVPHPANVMIFCFSAIAFDEIWNIPGESNVVEVRLNKRLLEFGSHALVIGNPQLFSARLNNAVKASPYIYGSKYFQGGYGLVEYVDLERTSGNIGVFRKDKRYSWQNEFRLCFGVRDEGLNSEGAFEFQIVKGHGYFPPPGPELFSTSSFSG